MIHIVNSENRRLYHHALMEMHLQRKTVFIDELKWKLDASSGIEIDAYDSAAAIYLIEADAPRAPVTASARLLPTTTPHLMGEVFAHLCKDGPPAGPTIWEATRFCPAPGTPKGEPRQQTLGRMIAAIMETALIFGIEQVSFVAGAALAPLAEGAGWDVTRLGVPQRHGRERLIAMLAKINPEGLRRVRERYGIVGPIARFTPGELAHAA